MGMERISLYAELMPYVSNRLCGRRNLNIAAPFLFVSFFFIFFKFIFKESKRYMKKKKIRAGSVKTPLKSSNSKQKMTVLWLLSATGLPCL